MASGTDPKENTSTAAPLLRACPLPCNGCKQTLPLLTLLTHSVHVQIRMLMTMIVQQLVERELVRETGGL
jgi:hypothetical protein